MFLLNEHVESVEAENTEQALKDESHTQDANSTTTPVQESVSDQPKPTESSTETKKPKSGTNSLIPLSKLIEAGVHLGLKPNK